MDHDQGVKETGKDLNVQDLGVDPIHLGKPTKGWVILLWAVLLIGFPTVGMFYFYKDAQNRIAGSAEPFVRQTLPEILGEGNRARLEDLATIRFDRSKLDDDWSGWQSEFGPLVRIESLKPVSTIAGGAEDDMVWQMISYDVAAIFEKKSGTVHVTAARRTTLPKDWRIERFSITAR